MLRCQSIQNGLVSESFRVARYSHIPILHVPSDRGYHRSQMDSPNRDGCRIFCIYRLTLSSSRMFAEDLLSYRLYASTEYLVTALNV